MKLLRIISLPILFLTFFLFSCGNVQATIFYDFAVHIVDGVSGQEGDCASIGVWDAGTKTCTLTKNVTVPIWVDIGGATLDGAEYTVSGNVNIKNRSGVTVKNIFLSNTTLSIDTSASTTVTHNTFTGNRIPIYIFDTQDVTIVQNNFLGYAVGGSIQSFNSTSVSTSTISQSLPVGGNYYASYNSGSSIAPYICTDVNSDNVCDTSFVLSSDFGGDTIVDNFPWVTASGWLHYTPAPQGDSNVLFLPGLEASRLYKPRTNCSGPLCSDQLWEPNTNGDVQDLYLNPDGTSKNPAVFTKDILNESNVPVWTGAGGQNIYKSFSNTMDGLVSSGKIAKWQAFAYDWRQSPEDVVNTPQKYDNDQTISLIGALQSLANTSKNGKVTIIAHSNGGLVAKALLKKLQDDKTAGINNLIDEVDVLILIASPQLGTPSAVAAMLHGYDQRIGLGLLMDEAHARELGRNMPGGYGLLPSKQYINTVEVAPVTFTDSAIASGVVTPFVYAYGSTTDSYVEFQNFLKGNEGRIDPATSNTLSPIKLSSALLAKADALHTSIDNWIPPESLRIIQIAGWGIDTIASFEYIPKFTCVQNVGGSGCTSKYILDERPIFTADGDKTVVTPSALAMGGERWWVNLPLYNVGLTKNRYHPDILEVDSLLDFISNTIQKVNIDNLSYLSTVTPVNVSNRLRLSVHSPVTVDAYDVNGNHTGKICSSTSDFCYIEENIPNSSYLEFGEGKYLNLPEDKAKSIKLVGTDVGTFTFEIEKVLPTGQNTTTVFIDIPVTPQTTGEFAFNPLTQAPELKLDVTGDGINDFTLVPSATFDPIVYLQIMKKTIETLDINPISRLLLNLQIDTTIQAIKKGKISKAKLKVEQFKKALSFRLQLPDPKRPNPKFLSKADAQKLIMMLNQLLVNLN